MSGVTPARIHKGKSHFLFNEILRSIRYALYQSMNKSRLCGPTLYSDDAGGHA